MSETRSPLRVGVVLDGVRPPAWAAWVVRAIRAHENLDLTLAVICDGGADEPPSALFALYETLDRRLFRMRPDALESVDVSAALEGVPRLHALLAPVEDDGHRLQPRDVAAVRGHSLDVLLRLGAARLRGELLSAARHGLWSFHHGDPVRYRGEPPLFWELFFGEPGSTSALEILAEDPADSRVIYRSLTATDPVSLERNRNPVYWKTAHFALRRLDDLATGRWKAEPDDGTVTRSASRPGPSNADTLRHAVRVVGRVARRRVARATAERQWFLGFRPRRGDVLPHEDPAPWRIAMPPRDRYWADPFVVEGDGETLVFFEQVRFERGRGELALARLEGDGRLTAVEPLLPAAHHLSYPYVFRDGGRAFMIPESSSIGRVELWAATDFPLGWERVATLLEGVNAVDASVLRHGELYWMWVNVAVPGGRIDDEAFLYFSDRLESGWTAHPASPVVSDARRARSAGRPFLHGDVLIRPAQDCTGRYGARVVFNAIEVLTVDDYRERSVGVLGPEWAETGALGAHTYTFAGRWEATDALGRRPRWAR